MLLDGEPPAGMGPIVELTIDRAARGRGNSSPLARFIENFARKNGVEAHFWLFTRSAEGVYAKFTSRGDRRNSPFAYPTSAMAVSE